MIRRDTSVTSAFLAVAPIALLTMTGLVSLVGWRLPLIVWPPLRRLVPRWRRLLPRLRCVPLRIWPSRRRLRQRFGRIKDMIVMHFLAFGEKLDWKYLDVHI